MSQINYLQHDEILKRKEQFPLFASLCEAVETKKSNKQWLLEIPEDVIGNAINNEHDLILTAHFLDELISKRQMPIKPNRVMKLLPKMIELITLEIARRNDLVFVEWSETWSFGTRANIQFNEPAMQEIIKLKESGQI